MFGTIFKSPLLTVVGCLFASWHEVSAKDRLAVHGCYDGACATPRSGAALLQASHKASAKHGMELETLQSAGMGLGSVPWQCSKVRAVLSGTNASSPPAMEVVKAGLLKYITAQYTEEGFSTDCIPPSADVPDDLCDRRAILGTPRRIVDVFLFSYEVDVLEIRLREYKDVVDKFVLIEADRDHHGRPKSSVWEMVKNHTRFQDFRHLVESRLVKIPKPDGQTSDMWWVENHQTDEQKKVAAEEAAGTVMIAGHVDEIPSRVNMLKLKHCAVKLPMSLGIWFPWNGNLNTAFKSDFPLHGHQFTLGDPVASFSDEFVVGGRGGGTHSRSDSLIGGAHLTSYCYLPNLLMKMLTATEGSGQFASMVDTIREDNHACQSLVDKCYKSYENTKYRVVSLAEFRKLDPDEFDRVVHVPWFLNCNRARFPAFYGLQQSVIQVAARTRTKRRTRHI